MKIFKIARVNDFQDWFGGSKVIDSAGNPMSVYHGTNQDFTRFNFKSLGLNTFSQPSKEGFFFTEDLDEAKAYANLSASQQIKNRNDHEQKENKLLKMIEKAELKNDWDLAEKLIRELEDLSLGAIRKKEGQLIYHTYLSVKNPFYVDGKEIRNVGDILETIKLAKEKGCDGVNFKGIDDGFGRPTNQWAVFHPNQIRIIKKEQF